MFEEESFLEFWKWTFEKVMNLELRRTRLADQQIEIDLPTTG